MNAVACHGIRDSEALDDLGNGPGHLVHNHAMLESVFQILALY